MIEQKTDQGCACTSTSNPGACDPSSMEMLPMFHAAPADEPCCGPPAGPRSNIHEQPGYELCDFVEDFLDTPAGKVPRVGTAMGRKDLLGALRVRIGIARDEYKVAPGLYAVGQPGADAPVLVTANYKLSFDHLRKFLLHVDAWVLVLDTRGINVWCAAGKTTFGTQEVIDRVKAARLADVVSHRRLILPQLGAPGVSAREVKKGCGFEVAWGPVRAQDLPAYLGADQKADAAMRRVTFSTRERLVLVPVELWLIRKPFLWILLGIFVLSGIGPHVFSFSAAWERSLQATGLALVGIVAGAAVVPFLLPWIPGRAFALKGIQAGAVFSAITVLALGGAAHFTFWSGLSLVLFSTAISSYLAMNFTGTTPFTSPSGVEKEMRRFIPAQLGAVVLAAILWVGAAF